MAGAGALVVAAYLSASRRDVDGTTEVAALVVLAAGLLAGLGQIRVASGCIAVTLLLLVEKRSLHGWVSRLDRAEMRAGARFAVMAAVILPLLPPGPYGPADTVRPRVLWALVLLFSGLSFVGYISRRAIGSERGYALAGTLGGLLSSTSVTLTFSRLSRIRPYDAVALAAGTLGANAMLFPRVLLATAVLALPLTRVLWPAFVVPAVIAAVLTVRQLRVAPHTAPSSRPTPEENPLQIKAALQMAALFQAVLFGVAFATRWFGQSGVYGSAAVLGLADMDAPNAFAFYRQGRPVVAISLSWLDQLGQDVDALATTIGHELAHLYLGHTGTARQERENTAQGASQIVGTALSLAGVPMAGAIANVGAIAVARSFSRDEERAADDYGIRWAVAAGYDPCGRARTMRMYQRLRAGTVEIPFLSTHPGAAERSELADAYSLKTTNRPCLE